MIQKKLTLAYSNPFEERRRDEPYSATFLVGAGIGFSLLLLVVLLLPPRFSNDPGRARKSAASWDISQMTDAIAAFAKDVGRVPTSAEGLNELVTDESGLAAWRGPYLEKILSDPWGHPYVYRQPGMHRKPYDLFSSGPDGIAGNGDDIVKGIR